MEEMLQHAGGQLCSQQSAACGLFTESGKDFYTHTSDPDPVADTRYLKFNQELFVTLLDMHKIAFGA